MKKDGGSNARIAAEIKPDEVRLNNPPRTCAAEPLSREEMKHIVKHFKGLDDKGEVIRRREVED